jgi:hypothetical protein
MDGLDRTIERACSGDRNAAEQLRRIFHRGRSLGTDDLRVRQYVARALAATVDGTDPAAALQTEPRSGQDGPGHIGPERLREGLLAEAVVSWVEDEGASLTDALQWTAEAWSLADAGSVRAAVERHRPDLLA